MTFADHGNGTAVIAGTPASGTSGVYDVTITASNGVSPDTTQSFTLTVLDVPTSPLDVSATPGVGAATVTWMPPASDGQSTIASYTVTASPGGANASVGGSATQATVSGLTPGAQYSFTMTATNTIGTSPASAPSNTVTIDLAPSSVAVSGPSSVTVGTGYSATSAVGNTPAPSPTYSFASGAPSWLSINANTGVVSATSVPEVPDFTYEVVASNAAGSATSPLVAVTVSPGSTLLNISPAQPPPIMVGAHVTYTATVTKTSGSGALSGVISFSGKGGTVQGCSNLPVSAGKASCTITFGTQGTFTIKAVYTGDPYFTSSSDFVTQSVSSSGAPTFTSPSSDTATAGTMFDFDVTTSGTPAPAITETGALPSGLHFADNGNGTATISGPLAAESGGTYPLTLTAKSTGGTAKQSFVLTVDQAPVFTSPASVTGTVDASFKFKIKTSAYPVATVTETGSLPGGLIFKAKKNGTAVISGTPAPGSQGTYDITLDASNGIGNGASQSLTVTVDPRP